MRVTAGHAPGPCLRAPRIYWSREVAGVMVGSGRERRTNLLHVTLYPPGRSSFSHHRGRWGRGPRGYGLPPSLPGYSWASLLGLGGDAICPRRGRNALDAISGRPSWGGAGCGAAPGPGMAAAAVAAAPGRAGGARGAP